MIYAIVDIETTGGYAANNDITEVAIVLHDGEKVVDRFESLVQPQRVIPHYIQVLTGITPAMVEDAPTFTQLAPQIYQLLQGNVFIAHNVNFDYSFLKHHLSQAGYELTTNKLCTVRLSKKVFPGFRSYSLGNLCQSLDITMENRHRAGGDADATVRLFERLLNNGALSHIEQFVKKGAKEQSLPPNLAKEAVESLPYTPGVYYFHDQKGKVLYVGKAKNLRYRVRSHFTHNGAGRQRQEFLRNIHSITYQTCATELMAFILESVEIKRLWPPYNSSQKRFTPSFGLYLYEDSRGYQRLAIDKIKKSLTPIYTFNLLLEGHRLMRRLIENFNLCPKLCNMQKDTAACSGVEEGACQGACDHREAAGTYNDRVNQALEYLDANLPTFALVDEGQQSIEQSCILIEKGRFYGMGYLPQDCSVHDMDSLKGYLTRYPENDYIRGLVYQHIEKYPHKKVTWKGEA
ncbi:exonuclease domain-containing protein [Paraflavitalea sp. CAU 1676]|uniref:exonuclease domain-containing protein n=1 Tax=Paraflavitalea sp. CAU 1676 TaxID=3032598 RepID=UPI0023DC45A3|nr:exonuclease domain-containing protein [Paraflavitalea sp. CAU 1676]MDF2188783.1 exonuclease domain-containing protein [Paraflavitalea sp. CAU 1676]